MSVTGPSPNQSAVMDAFRAFLTDVLPASIPIVQGQINRVPEPAAADFVTYTPLRLTRIETNIDTAVDAVFVGSIAGATLTVTSVIRGTLAVGRAIYGVGLADGTKIAALGSGTGGAGTYTVNNAQTVTSRTISAGTMTITQNVMAVIQVDVHGPNSFDNAQIISTMMRDPYAVEFFAALNPNISPLYADDPRQMPFVNEQQAVENRWVIEAALQSNTSVIVGQQFADAVSVDLIEVDAAYPPT